MKMWSGRLKQPLDPAFEQWQRSFPFDHALIGEELAASAAHAHALVGAGVLTQEEAARIASALKEIGEKIKVDPRLLQSEEGIVGVCSRKISSESIVLGHTRPDSSV